MRDTISYEWHIECADEHGDVNNIDFADSHAEALASQAVWAKDEDYVSVNIALVRTEGNEYEGINWRGYSYLRDGKLEPVFSSYHGAGPTEDQPANDGPDVPQRFHKEVAKAA